MSTTNGPVSRIVDSDLPNFEMVDSTDSLISIASSVFTKRRVRIFCNDVPSLLHNNGHTTIYFIYLFTYPLHLHASDEEKYDLVREGLVIFLGVMAKHLAKDDPKVHTIVEKLLDVLNTPFEPVQRAVSTCLSPLMRSMQLMKSDKYRERRGAAFGFPGVVKGFGISSLKKYKVGAYFTYKYVNPGLVVIVNELEWKIKENKYGSTLISWKHCATSCSIGLEFDGLFRYVIQMLPLLLVSFSDQVVAVREAAHTIMSQLNTQGVKLVLPSL
ncbi:hypothetical protein Dsin_024160 [Dipteronia sinensis]|uniref:Uncharacterized protein n=1 Tax=Dipteronia sinensis TaxID=43782 RepID=A0AAE0A4R5_9ROSI|nr:hypothetical protein Dsin_024160 [Dipteronia sinensis]